MRLAAAGPGLPREFVREGLLPEIRVRGARKKSVGRPVARDGVQHLLILAAYRERAEAAPGEPGSMNEGTIQRGNDRADADALKVAGEHV